MAGIDTAGTDELTELWRAMAAAARGEDHEVAATACEVLAERVAVGLDPSDRATASLDAAGRAVGSPLDLDDRAEVLAHLAGGWDLAGDPTAAASLLVAALAEAPGHLDSHLRLAHVRLPGPGYYELLDRLHDLIRPNLYLEIGMGDGSSMALARRRTRAVGVDPFPTLLTPIVAECLVVPQRSEDFFAREDLRRVLPSPPDLAFIDGLHTFPAVLDDFIGVERNAGPGTVVAIHDTIPLDEPTQRPDRVHAFYTGDVWKLLPVLWDLRPDLCVTTVRTSPSGLTLVTGLDPDDRTLAERRSKVLSEYGGLPFSMAASTRGATLPDDWGVVRDHLVAQGVRAPARTSGLASS